MLYSERKKNRTKAEILTNLDEKMAGFQKELEFHFLPTVVCWLTLALRAICLTLLGRTVSCCLSHWLLWSCSEVMALLSRFEIINVKTFKTGSVNFSHYQILCAQHQYRPTVPDQLYPPIVGRGKSISISVLFFIIVIIIIHPPIHQLYTYS